MKNQKHCYQFTGFIMSICLVLVTCLSVMITDVSAVQAAKKKPKLTKKSLSLALVNHGNPGRKGTLKVKNPVKKVAWKSSNKKIAVVERVSGKKKQKAVILGKKQGTCTITATTGGKKLKCKVKVKAPEEPQNTSDPVTQGAVGITVTSVSATGSSLTLQTTVYNRIEGGYYYIWFGYDFRIEKWTDTQWKAVEIEEIAPIPAVLMGMAPEKEMDLTCTITKTKQPLTSGHYRVVKDYFVEKVVVKDYSVRKLNEGAGGLPGATQQTTYQMTGEFDVTIP